MEAQTIAESVPRTLFVTSTDNKIGDDSQIPYKVRNVWHTMISMIHLTFFCRQHRSIWHPNLGNWIGLKMEGCFMPS